MTKQTYHVWQSGPDYKFRWQGQTMKVEWNLARQRELTKLLAAWMEDAEPADPRCVKKEEPEDAE